MKKLLHFAMKEEAASVVEIPEEVQLPTFIELEDKDYDVWVTGIGTPAIVRAIDIVPWDNYFEIVNIGYAGCNEDSLNLGDIAQVKRVSHLDFYLPGNEPTVHPYIDNENLLFIRELNLPLVECMSSNRFVTNDHLNYIYNGGCYVTGLYDMEAATLYDLAKGKGKYLTSVKVVSDKLSSEEFDSSVVSLKERLVEAVNIVLGIEKEN